VSGLDSRGAEQPGGAAAPAPRSSAARATGWSQAVLANLARFPRLVLANARLDRRAPFWLLVRLTAPLEEVPRPQVFGTERRRSLLEVLRGLQAAARDSRVAGVLLHFAGAPRGLATAATLRRAVDELRGSKPVWAFGDRLGIAEYWVASGAERVLLPESGSLELLGLRSERFYVRELLQRLDVRPELLRVGGFKTAGETLVREGMSAEQREQIDAFLDDVLDRFVAAVAAGRRASPREVRALLDRGPLLARTARDAGWIDSCRFPDQVEADLVEHAPRIGEQRAGELRPRVVDVSTYDSLHAADSGWAPLGRTIPRLAYIVASGAVVRRRGAPLPAAISARGLGRLLERLRGDERIVAVVLRLTSPGGDALASDLLWRSVARLRERKPVIVSMGEVAASGGYLLAAGASAIVCEATALTGSIGVLGGKLDFSGLLERLGIHPDAVERGERAGMLSPTRPFRADERGELRKHLEEVYSLFLDRVCDGRGMDRTTLEPLAQGRVWSGARALEYGLIDRIGGPREAIAEALERAGMDASDHYRLDVLPRVSPIQALRDRLSLGFAVR